MSLSSLPAEPLSAPVLERYEEILLRTPEPGAAFDKVCQHYTETGGLDALAAKWREASAQPGAARADYLLLLGMLDERRGNTAEALRQFREAAESAESWRAWAALGNAEARLGALSLAVEALRKSLALHPPKDAHSALYRSLALCQQRAMDAAGAAETWLAYVEAAPKEPFVLLEAGDALMEAGRYDDAREVFQRLRDLDESSADPGRKLEASLRLAEVERQQGNKDQALQIYNSVLVASGQASWLQREVRSRIEGLFRSDDDLPGLVAFYRERLKSTPSDLDASLGLADALTELNRQAEALGVLEDAAGRVRERKDVQLRYAEALLRAERPGDAEAILRKAVETFPADPVLKTKLGDAQWRSFQLGKGSREAALDTWRSLAPDGAGADEIQRVAEIMRANGLSEEALIEYRRALATDPAAADRRERLALYLVELDRKPEALQELHGLVGAGRGTGETFLRLARLQRRLGENQAAKESLKAAREFPERGFDRFLLAWQIAADEKTWADAETHANDMRREARTLPERERGDECLVESLREQGKTNAEIRRLLDLQEASPGQVPETEWRLLYTLAVDADDAGTAEFALQQGLRQFPRSADLLKLEAAHARRTADMARRLAALERLEEIEPERRSDWIAERVRALRDAERWDEAIELSQKAVGLSPARTDAHLLLADTFLAAQKPDGAAAALEAAIRLADDPNQVRLRLADLHLSRGQFGPAREVIEKAFEAEETPAGKLRLMPRLANAYLQDGRIDELIEKLKSRQKAEQGGWRYALCLAEVYLTIQDNFRAMEELEKALSGKPDDPVLLGKLLGLAESNGDTTAALRFARKLADVEPSKHNRTLLGSALVKDGRLDEALALIKENAAEFLENPQAWQEAVSQIQAEERAGELANLLEGQLRANPDDWQSQLALGTILLTAGTPEKAAPVLWQIVEMKAPPEAAANAPASSASGPLPGVRNVSPAQLRQMRMSEKFQQAMAWLSTNRESVRSGRAIRFSRSSQVVQSPTLAGAQDEAIVYLACLAVREGKEGEFLEKLHAALRDRSSIDRVTIYAMLQAPEPLIRELESLTDLKELDPDAATGAFQSFRTMLANAQNNPGGLPVSTDRLKVLADRLAGGLAAGTSQQESYRRIDLLNALGNHEEANKAAAKLLADETSTDPSFLLMARQTALSRNDLAAALRFHERLVRARSQSGMAPQGGTDAGMAVALIGSEAHRSRGIAMLAEELISPAGMSATISSSRGSSLQRQYSFSQMRGNLNALLPYPTRDLDARRLALLRGLVLGNVRAKGGLPEVIRHFDQHGSPVLQQAAIWLRWYSGDRKGAEESLKALVDRKASPELLLNYAMMLAEAGKTQEAQKALERIQPGSKDAYEIACRLAFAIALKAKDKPASTAAAMKLASLRLIDYEQRELVNEMKRLGLKDEAARLETRSTRAQNPSQRSRQLVEIMRERMQAGNREEALSLAHAILGRDPFSRTARNEQYQQTEALRVLDKFGELGNHVANLQKALEAAPQSARLNAQLAQALELKDSRQAEPYYRRLIELRPQDPEWLQRLCNLLAQSDRNEEAMRYFEKLLASDPGALLSQGTSFIEPFRRTGNMRRLAEAMARSADPEPDPLSSYGQNFSHVFVEIGQALQRERPPVSPIDVWLKGVRWDRANTLQLQSVLAQALVREGRTAEAREVLEEAFFPGRAGGDEPRLFVFSRPSRPNMVWSQITIYPDGSVESPALRLMRIAAGLGFLREMAPHLAKLPASSDGVEPAILARVVLRDEAVLPEIRAWLEKPLRNQPGAVFSGNPPGSNGLRLVAGALSDWPRGREMAYEILKTMNRNAQTQGRDIGTRMTVNLKLAEMAIEDGKREMARPALTDWVAALDEFRQRGSQLDTQTTLRAMKLMAAVGMFGEARQLAATVRADRNFSRDSTFQQQLKSVENELNLLEGKPGDVLAVLAWSPVDASRTRIVWDIRAAGGDADAAAGLMDAMPLNRLSGLYDLEFYFGESENAMKRVFARPGAPARGSWTGRLPGQMGFVRVVLRKGEELRLGPARSIATGAILQSPESLLEIVKGTSGVAKGWVYVPPAPATVEKGGPLASEFVRFEGDRQNQMELIAERIPIDPAKNYMVGGWFRYPMHSGSARLGWRLCDVNGKEVGNYSGSGNFQGDQWNYSSVRFGRGPNSSSLPDSAAWIEPYAQFNGQCDLQGMFVTEIPTTEEQ